ncbi:MAG: right-handed parallel beta-helix repeat-containing protein [bacterium]
MRTRRMNVGRGSMALGCLALVVGLAACGDDDATGGNNNVNENGNAAACPVGHDEVGPACVPQFDTCPGDNEIPQLGGGCLEIGITQCATGFASDDTGSCEAVLPPAECGPGTMPVLGETTCQPVGVQTCPAGFDDDGQAGCKPVLPTTACGDDELEVLGQTSCQPLGSCGTGTWGNILDDGITIYVDAGSTAGNPDGSTGAPYPTIAAGLGAVTAGGQIAIAPGVYDESVLLGQEIRLTGRCASLVRINGVGAAPAVEVSAAGSDSVIRGVTLSGANEGLVVSGALGVLMEESRVTATGAHGIDVEADGELTLVRVKVELATGRGISFQGSSLDLSECVVQDMGPESDSTQGRGLSGACDSAGTCGAMVVDRSVFQRNRDVAVYHRGTDLTLTDSLIRDSLPQLSDGSGGWALAGRCDPDANVCGTMTVSGVTMLDNREQSFTSVGIATVATDVTIRNTEAGAGGAFGIGLVAFCDPGTGDCGTLLFENGVVDGSREAGALLFGPVVTFRGVVLQNTEGKQSDQTVGPGISMQCMAGGDCGSLRLEDSVVENNRSAGILAGGADLTVVRSVVRDTRPQLSDEDIGTGITAQCDPVAQVCGQVLIDQSIVERNHLTGIGIAGPDAVIRATLVRDTLEDASGEYGIGWGLMLGCDPVVGACGNVRVEGCVIEDNLDSGILGGSSPLRISGTVVRGTVPVPGVGWAADSCWGIGLGCDARGNCGATTITDSVVEQNHAMGIVAGGVELTVERTLVRDTVLINSERTAAIGIMAGCDYDGICAPAAIRDTIIDAVPGAGIEIYGSDGVVERSLIRNVVGSPNVADMFAWGVIGMCAANNPNLCGSLSVSECLFEGNQAAALAAGGTTTVVRSSLVRDTVETEVSNGYGFGFEVSCHAGVCAPVTIEDCGFEGNTGTGILLYNVPATVHRTAVIQTSALQTGVDSASHGYGVSAECTFDVCPNLGVTKCLLRSNSTAGLSVRGYGGFVQGTVIDAVAADPLDGAHGYGVQIAGTVAGAAMNFNVTDCDITDAALAGILFHQASGVVSNTRISGGDFPVVLSTGADANILDNNVLVGNLANEPTWTTVEPAAAPPPDEPVNLGDAPELP